MLVLVFFLCVFFAGVNWLGWPEWGHVLFLTSAVIVMLLQPLVPEDHWAKSILNVALVFTLFGGLLILLK
jgi:hypothetical protein